MCEFISWYRAKMPDNSVQILFLTDKDVFSSYGQEKLKGAKDNDYIGHGAIKAFFDLQNSQATLMEFENQNFWYKKQFPPEIAVHLESPETMLKTWGKILEQCLQIDDICYILDNAPESWLSAIINIETVLNKISTDAHLAYQILSSVKGLTESQKDKLIDGVSTDSDYSYQALRDITGLTESHKDILVNGVSDCAYDSSTVLQRVQGLTKSQKDKLVSKVSTKMDCSYDVLCYVQDLTEPQQDKLINKLSTSAYWAQKALYAEGLTKSQKNKLKKKIQERAKQLKTKQRKEGKRKCK